MILQFDPRRQCCWCGSDNTAGTEGYAGERGCPVCGWGGEGEADVPCMYYKLARPPTRDKRGYRARWNLGGVYERERTDQTTT
jgi:hypothetical protein